MRVRLPKGLRIKDVKVGTGEVAARGRVAIVHYDCFLPRGDKVGSSRDRPFPAQFRIGQRDICVAIDYGVLGMAVGGIRSIRVGPQLAHVEWKIHPDLPPDAALRYELELVGLSDTWDNSIHARLYPWLAGDA